VTVRKETIPQFSAEKGKLITYDGVSKSFRTDRLKRERQMVIFRYRLSPETFGYTVMGTGIFVHKRVGSPVISSTKRSLV
jgi:hypothetical protein